MTLVVEIQGSYMIAALGSSLDLKSLILVSKVHIAPFLTTGKKRAVRVLNHVIGQLVCLDWVRLRHLLVPVD